jgi:CBS domain containing-hemolysin-like protein
MSFIFILILVLINAFFVLAEFALVKVRYAQVEIRAKEGNSQAAIIQHILDHIDKYLATTQVGITIMGMALWWAAETVLSDVLSVVWPMRGIDVTSGISYTISFILVFVLITLFQIIIGELTPKSIAIRYSLESALIIWLPLRMLYILFRPLTRLIGKISATIMKTLGIDPDADDQVHSEEELKMLLAESQEWWAIHRSEHELIQNVFDFDDRTVKQIMCNVHDIVAIDVKSNTDEIMKLIAHEGYSRYPVYDGDIDTIIWVVHATDIFKQYISTHKVSLKNLLKQIHFVPGVQKVHDLLKLFQQSHKHMAVVTSEFGTTLGLVSMEDILEELVGEIQDESDNETPLIEQIKDDEYLVDAMIGIIDANDTLPSPIPDHEWYQTVSWYINHLWGRIPHEGQEMDADGYHIKIVKRTKQRVELVRMKVL